jgi:hypothetical protein
MEAKDRVHRYYVEEKKVDLLGLDDLEINLIEVALSDLAIRLHQAVKEDHVLIEQSNLDKVNDILKTIKNRQQE